MGGNNLKEDFEDFYSNFKVVLRKIKNIYINIPILNNESKKIIIHRERVYCYELYHQLRCQLNKIHDRNYFLFGEEDKRGIYKKDELNKIPDFIIHIPGSNYNFAIVEVKSIMAKTHDIIKDYNKIKDFIRYNNYKYGILLLFGEGNNKIPKAVHEIKSEIEKNETRNIKLIWHKDSKYIEEII
jgi:tRNA(Leu) C34 or U34 (ribose-2'-O)-methylase TrmL